MARYAAVDIGSNSVRMEAAEVSPGSPPRILASDRQVIRLGESVFHAGVLSEEAIALACEVLAKMAAGYAKLEVAGVRVVATSAVRDASNQAEFVERASAAVGAPVEIISGREEARLIHLGVQSRWPQGDKSAIVIDIGGGSAEIIASENGRMRDAISKPLGAVRLKEIFLQHDPPEPDELRRLDEFIHEKLLEVTKLMGGRSWDRAIATAATASAVVCAIAKVPRSKRELADRLRASTPEVRKLQKKLAGMSLAARRKVTGIGPRRAEIVVPGITVLLRVLERFGFRSVYYSAAGVRDGIIADLAGRGVGREPARLSAEQRKEVESLSSRYGVSLKHARKVAAFARSLFDCLQPLHRLPPPSGRLLEAAAYLHDIGHFVNDSAHHKHSYYLVANSDMSGFTSRERELIATLCRYHRKASPRPSHSEFQGLSADEQRQLQLLIPLLRLADSLDRSHEQRVDSVQCNLRDGHVALSMLSQEDVALEQWAADRAGDLFRQVYGRTLSIEQAPVQAGMIAE